MRKTLLLLSLVLSFGATAQTRIGVDPIVDLGDIRRVYLDGNPVYPTLTIDEILANHPKINNTSDFKLRRYCLSFYSNDRMEVYGPVCNKGTEYSQEIKDLLHKNASGLGTVYFEDISVVGPDGRTRAVNSISVNFR